MIRLNSNGRLATIARLVEKTESLSDIGCDHGFLSLYVLCEGLSQRVTACDISEPSLLKAKKLCENYLNVDFLCADGADAIAMENNTAVVSGLGGPEIVRMLPFSAAQTLILQPQNRISDVRRALNRYGYKIIADIAVCERKKYYDVIKAVRGEQNLSDLQAEWGVFCKNPSPVLKQKLHDLEKSIMSYAPTKENEKKLKLIKEVKQWQ